MSSNNKPVVRLTCKDGNAFAIIGACKQAARKAKWPKEKIDELVKKMMSSDYNNLLTVAQNRFDVR